MTTDPMSRLFKAREAAEAGRHQEALDEYIWFHHQALEQEPAVYGVRLSFALAYWMDLGLQYPKALEELKAIGQRKTAQLLAGECDSDLFHDVSSINEALGTERATYELFVELDRRAAEFAASCAHIAMPAIMEAGDHELARRHMGDLQEAVHQLSDSFNLLISDLAEHARDSGEEEDEGTRADRVHALAYNHAASLRRILDVAQVSGEDESGLRGLALRSIEDEGMQQAVSRALQD